MLRETVITAIFITACLGNAGAIEDVPTVSYNESPPTNSNIANWSSGWTQPTVQPTGYTSTTGWNYVGTVGGNSGTYLGNGWVITAAHVPLADFVLGGVDFPLVPNSSRQIGTTDLMLFQVSPCPALPLLPLRSADPVAYSTLVVMLGFGHLDTTRNESWGCDTVNFVDQSITPVNTSYVSNEFITLTGASSNGVKNVTNNYQVVEGDSGGGDFVYNTTSKIWELAGINEVNGTITYKDGTTQDYSGCIQINTYAAQIRQIVSPAGVDLPSMPPWALVALGGVLFHAGVVGKGLYRRVG